MNRSWTFLLLAGPIEVLWTIGLKHSSTWLSWLGTALLIYVSFALLMKAARTLPVATVYAVFTGAGTAGTVLIDMLVFGEAFSWMKILFILLLLTGVIGLKLVTAEAKGGA